MSYYLCVDVLSKNASILCSLLDLLSVCLRYCMAVASQLTQVRLRITYDRRISCSCVHVLGVHLIIGGLKDHLGVTREGVWAVSLCLT